jgi:hypothetical protein
MPTTADRCGFGKSSLQHPHLLGFEDGIEGSGVVPVAVAENEAQSLDPTPEVSGEIAGLLRRPYKSISSPQKINRRTGVRFHEARLTSSQRVFARRKIGEKTYEKAKLSMRTYNCRVAGGNRTLRLPQIPA